VAAETGHLGLAYDYFAEAADMDLEDLEHNTRDGLHIASLAGAWIAAVCGFGGLRDDDGILSFSPRLPQELTRMALGVGYRGRLLRVEIIPTEARYTLRHGPELKVMHHGQTITLSGNKPASFAIPEITAGEPPRQPSGRAPRPAKPQ